MKVTAAEVREGQHIRRAGKWRLVKTAHTRGERTFFLLGHKGVAVGDMVTYNPGTPVEVRS